MELESMIAPLLTVLASTDSKLTALTTSLDTHFCDIAFSRAPPDLTPPDTTIDAPTHPLPPPVATSPPSLLPLVHPPPPPVLMSPPLPPPLVPTIPSNVWFPDNNLSWLGPAHSSGQSQPRQPTQLHLTEDDEVLDDGSVGGGAHHISQIRTASHVNYRLAAMMSSN